MKKLLLVSAMLLLFGWGCQKRVGLSVRGGLEEIGTSVIVDGRLVGRLGKVEELWVTTSPQDTSAWGGPGAAAASRLETNTTIGRLDAVVRVDRECSLLFVSTRGESLLHVAALGDSAEIYIAFGYNTVKVFRHDKPNRHAGEYDGDDGDGYHDEVPSTVADTAATPTRAIADSADATPRN